MRSLRFELRPELPRLAWLIDATDRGCIVYHGSGVETFKDGFFEGCWDGPFRQARFDEAVTVFGSGARIDRDAVVVVTPTHTLDPVFVMTEQGRFSASNSLAFLLEFHDIEMPVRRGYGKMFASLVQGLRAQETVVCEVGGQTVTRYIYGNIVFRGGRVEIRGKKDAEAFRTYDDYVGFLTRSLESVLANGADPARTATYAPISTISSGYDSAASAALGAKLGVREALTLVSDQDGGDDSGAVIAQHLGMEVHAYDRRYRNGTPDLLESVFLSTGTGGEDFVWHVFEPHLANRLVTCGIQGDKVWGLKSVTDRILTRADLAGATLSEWRLEVGFCLAPVPFMGATRHPEIAEISRSPEMRPFSVGGYYDRPVPRRLLEEMGVPRGTFGLAKKAVTVQFFKSIRDLSEPSARALRAYRARMLGLWRSVGWQMLGYWHDAREGLWVVARKLCRMAGAPRLRGRIARLLIGDWKTFEHTDPIDSDLAFLWALDLRRRRYRSAGPNLAASDSDGSMADGEAARPGERVTSP